MAHEMLQEEEEQPTCLFYKGGLAETVQPTKIGNTVVPPGIFLKIIEVIHQTESLRVSLFKPYPKIKLGNEEEDVVPVFDEYGRPNVKNLSAQAFFAATTFRIGMKLETLTLLTARQEEELDSPEIAPFEPWSKLILIEKGRYNFRRGKVISESGSGWISLVTTEGTPMVQQRPCIVKMARGGLTLTMSRATKQVIEIARNGNFAAFVKKTRDNFGCCSRRANLSYTDMNGKNCLLHAASMGHYKICENLVFKFAREFDIQWKDDAERTALHWAAVGSKDSKGTNAKENMSKTKTNATGGPTDAPDYPSVIWLLITQGCDKDARDFRGQTPLSLAVLHNHIDCCRRLLLSSANYHVRDKAGMSPLDHAIIQGHQDIVRLLRFNMETSGDPSMRPLKSLAESEYGEMSPTASCEAAGYGYGYNGDSGYHQRSPMSSTASRFTLQSDVAEAEDWRDQDGMTDHRSYYEHDDPDYGMQFAETIDERYEDDPKAKKEKKEKKDKKAKK